MYWEISKTVSDNTMAAESLGDFFKSPGKKWLNESKKMTTKFLRSPIQPLDLGANLGSTFASKNSKAALLTLPEVIKSSSYR